MNGKVIPGTPIAVDFWRTRECPTARLFFLTHLHGDHIVGLSSSWQYKIYCSEITGRLLEERFEIERSLICPLETGTSHIVYMDSDQLEQMSVTVIDARHCPGSVMFLFEGYFGKILYTGDFRFSSDMKNDPLMEKLRNADILYLDNTYNCTRCVFPSREHCLQQIIDIIRSNENHQFKIGIRNLGKEELLVKIAVDLKEWIKVPPAFFQLAEILDLPDLFITGETESRIAVVPFYSISNKNLERWNSVCPTIAVLPTSLYTGLEMNPFCNQENVFIVPYSDHCSFDELKEFVQLVKPSCIFPIVSGEARGPFGLSLSDRADVSVFEPFLCVSQGRKNDIPDSVKRWMYGNKTLKPTKVFTKKPYVLPKRRSLQKLKRGVHFDDSMENFSEPKRKKKRDQEEASGPTEKSNSQDGGNSETQSRLVDGKPSTTDKQQETVIEFAKKHEENFRGFNRKSVSDMNKSESAGRENKLEQCDKEEQKHFNVKEIHDKNGENGRNPALRTPVKNFIRYVTDTDSVAPTQPLQQDKQGCLTHRDSPSSDKQGCLTHRDSPSSDKQGCLTHSADRPTDRRQPLALHVIPISSPKSDGKLWTGRPHTTRCNFRHHFPRPLNVKPL